MCFYEAMVSDPATRSLSHGGRYMTPRRGLPILAAALLLALADISGWAANKPNPATNQPAAMPSSASVSTRGYDLDDSDDKRRDDDSSWRQLGSFTTFVHLTAAEEEKRFGSANSGSASGAKAAETPAAASTALPTWRLGDKFIYDDGGWEQLTAIEDGAWRFVNQDGEVSLRDPDFTLPARRFQAPDGQIRESRILPPSAGETADLSLWPLSTGKTSAFIEDGATRREGAKMVEERALWRCQVMAAAAKTVAAGKYDCQRIVCRRLSSDKKEILEEIRWDYAPAIQYWLGRETRLPEAKRLYRELAAIFPGFDQFAADEVRDIRRQWQDSLAATPQGETDLWLAADGSRSVAITPGPAFRRLDGSLCRRYSQRLHAPGLDRVYPGMACENPAGAWQTPRQGTGDRGQGTGVR